MFSTFNPYLYNSNLIFLQSLAMRSQEKSLFLHHEREVWGLAAEVSRLQEEVPSLQTKEQEACQHADEADYKHKVAVAKAGEDAVELG